MTVARCLAPALAATLLLATAAAAEIVEKTLVGTLSNPLTGLADDASGGPDPATNPGLVSRGSKYVVKVSYDTNDIAAVAAAGRLFQTRDFFSVPLSDAPGGTNTFELFIPSEGFGGVLTQTGLDHFTIGGGSATTAEIHFFESCASQSSCDAAFRGLEFESNFIRNNSASTPAAGGDIVFELRDPDANFGDGPVTSHVVNVLDGNLAGLMFNGGHVDVRSESATASGGQLTPGVFLREAVPVIAEAGASPLVYDAGTLSITTNGGTALVTEVANPVVPDTLRQAPSPIDFLTRQADNDLGAARSDGEDLLTFQWTVDGSPVAGNLDGTRLDREVATLSVANPNTQQHGSRFEDGGVRTVSDVNIAVGIAASGLTNTTDVVSFDLDVTEDITGLSGSDSVQVSYANAGPTATTGGPLSYSATTTTVTADGGVVDADLAVNGLIAGFESHGFDWTQGGNPLVGTPVGLEDLMVQILDSGLTTTLDVVNFDLEVTDFAGASDTGSIQVDYTNTNPVIANATATPVGGNGLLFDLDVQDADLAINGLGLVDFELLSIALLLDGNPFAGLATLLATGSEQLTNGQLVAIFGLGLHTLEIRVADRALADMASFVSETIQFEVIASEPGMLLMMLSGLAAARLRAGHGSRKRLA